MYQLKHQKFLKMMLEQLMDQKAKNEFSSAAIKKFCDDNNIRLDTSVAKEEHISNGNKLGIIDRLVRTLRELIEIYFDITGHRFIELII